MEKLELSQVNLPISINLKEIELTINQQVDEILHDNLDLAEDSGEDLVIKAEKGGGHFCFFR